jgi:hypothetical protein
MNWKALLCALLAVLVLTGCGGSSNGTNQGHDSEIAAVKVREAALVEAVFAKDLDRAMEFFSDSYSSGGGSSDRATLQQGMAHLFSVITIVSADPNFRSGSYIVRGNGDITSGEAGRMRVKNSDSQNPNETILYTAVSPSVWRNESGVWRIIAPLRN